MNTLAELQQHVATECNVGNPLASCAVGNPHLATQQAAQRLVTDFVCGQFTVSCHKTPNLMTPRDQERFGRVIQRRAGRYSRKARVEQYDASGEKCGFIFLIPIIGGVLSWLIGKALDALWAWWSREKASGAAALPGMFDEAVKCGAGAWSDDD